MTSGDALRFRTDERCPIEVAVAVHVLTRMLALGCPFSLRIAESTIGLRLMGPVR